VTYFSKEKSKDFHYIKYSEWQQVNGLLLPKSLEWYQVVDGKITAKRNELQFSDVTISKENPDDTIFMKPENARTIE